MQILFIILSFNVIQGLTFSSMALQSRVQICVYDIYLPCFDVAA